MRISHPHLVLIVLLLLTLAPQARAFTAVDTESQLFIDDIDIAPTNTPFPKGKPTFTPTPPQQPQKQPRAIITPAPFFSFSLSGQEVDFGTVDPTNPVVRTHTFIITPGSTPLYQLLASEDHKLQSSGKDIFIPDTSCDDGKCSDAVASIWESSLTYGLGYRCDHIKHSEIPCANSFQHAGYYKNFADFQAKETGSVVLTELGGLATEAKITYKLNVPGTQPKGYYANSLRLIAVPGL